MTSFLLYLVEVNLVLALFYCAYRLLLSKETFFTFNRFFLMGIIVLSILFPLISLDLSDSDNNFISQQSTDLGIARSAYYNSMVSWSELSDGLNGSEVSGQGLNPWQVILTFGVLVYAIGSFYHLGKLIHGYKGIYGLKRNLNSTHRDGLRVAELPPNMGAFSFLNTVFIPTDIKDESEYTQILAHEKMHIQQRHSIDLIFVHLVSIFLWFNPVVWLLINSLKQTHEYIADKHMLDQGFSLIDYQSLLLKQLIDQNAYELAHNFNLSFIKKRMKMMAIKQSGWWGWSKLGGTIIFVLLIGTITAQSNTLLGRPSSDSSPESNITALEMTFYIDGVSLRQGISFSKLRENQGAFTFEFENNKEDKIIFGLDLMREGERVVSMQHDLVESASIDIKSLLIRAEQDDHLVIDLIEGPDGVGELFIFSLFKEGKGKKNDMPSDLPPSLVELTMNGSMVGPQQGVLLHEMKTSAGVTLEYKLSEFVDFGVISRQNGDVKATLIRNGNPVRSIRSKGVKRSAKVSISDLLEVARKGDTIMIQFGKPDGLRFGSQFLIQ